MDIFVIIVIDIRSNELLLTHGHRWLNSLLRHDYWSAAEIIWPPEKVENLTPSSKFEGRQVVGYRVPQSLKDDFADFARRKHIWFC
jgi:hypothetical protein